REEIFVAGNAIAPRHSKTRDFVYLRRPLVHERILWVSLRGTLSIRLDGVQMPLTSTWPSGASNTLRPAQIGRMHPRSARGRANVVASTAARHADGPRPDSPAGAHGAWSGWRPAGPSPLSSGTPGC